METAESRLAAGDPARITVGMHAGRVGTVRQVSHSGVHYVEFRSPVLVAEPDGPTTTVALPFHADELAAVPA